LNTSAFELLKNVFLNYFCFFQIAEEMEISKTKAERTLREHQGNVVEALASLTN
jgi:predicted DNA-binding protein (UPF0251 family)